MPIITSTTGKNITINIPGMIRKCGKIIINKSTRKRAPMNFRPKIRITPRNITKIGTKAEADIVASDPKKWPIPAKKSPIPGKLISQPLRFNNQSIPTIIKT